MDQTLECAASGTSGGAAGSDRRLELTVLLAAILVFLGCIISPPSLMDDVDAVQAQIARNMLESGDWVTARLNGVAYLEKSPLIYWLTAVSFAVFGVHDWAARLPVALAAVALCWLTYGVGAWASGARTGFYAGLAMSTSIGLWLFTRILIPDVILTLTVVLAVWSFLRAIDEEERRPRLWATVLAVSIGTGLLLKGLIAALFPVAAMLVYLTVTWRLFDLALWRRLHVFTGVLIALAISAPWHVLATIRNPPLFDWTWKSEPGQYHGFFWFYFLNEHVFRFLNMRHPRDYNTVPRTLFWLLHLAWFFPWSAWFPAVARLGFRPVDRGGRLRLMCLCWAGFILAFFTFSTTQEYYSMPAYPAMALLLGSALAARERRLGAARVVVGALFAVCGLAAAGILIAVAGTSAPGDISRALASQNTEAYTLSLGHLGDLTLSSFAYLRLPLAVAACAFALGSAVLFLKNTKALLAMAVAMVLFFHAARIALVRFDPYLSSRPLAEALKAAPPGVVIFDNQYYTFSSVFFYANTRGLLLNGRVNNLEYGSYAPGAPDVFLDDPELAIRWGTSERHYLLVEKPSLARVQDIIGQSVVVRESGGKFLLTNLAP